MAVAAPTSRAAMEAPPLWALSMRLAEVAAAPTAARAAQALQVAAVAAKPVVVAAAQLALEQVQSQAVLLFRGEMELLGALEGLGLPPATWSVDQAALVRTAMEAAVAVLAHSQELVLTGADEAVMAPWLRPRPEHLQMRIPAAVVVAVTPLVVVARVALAL